MTHTERLAQLYSLARRPSHLPITPDAGPAVVAWYESTPTMPSVLTLLDMLAWALTDDTTRSAVADKLASLTPSEN